MRFRGWFVSSVHAIWNEILSRNPIFTAKNVENLSRGLPLSEVLFWRFQKRQNDQSSRNSKRENDRDSRHVGHLKCEKYSFKSEILAENSNVLIFFMCKHHMYVLRYSEKVKISRKSSNFQNVKCKVQISKCEV